ncbi:DNA repair exonuclease SbcCD ATPase subunit [Roseovarius sp. MBR-79]|jgi:DNA repair exonuclease SbcCD ATPase subunit
MRSFVAATVMAGLLAFPAIAQDSEPDVASLVQDVTSIAQGLEGRIETLSIQMAEASDLEAGTKALDEMLAAAREVYDSLNRDSELWGEMNGMLDTWSVRRDNLLKEAQDVPALKDVASGWQDRIDRAITLRQQITEQAAESEALIAQIEDQRRVIIAYYEAKLADQALATMEVMSAELGAMNEKMSGILTQANLVAETPSVAQE